MVKNVSCIQINFLFLFFVGKDGRKIGGGSDAAKTANPTSSPSKWPGVRLLLSLLATENRDNSTKLRILLSEACVAVYLSLLALAWSNSQPNQLYRLVVNSLHSGMWGKVFGGGLRSAVQQTGGNYSRTPPYRRPCDTDTLLLRTVPCPWGKKALTYLFSLNLTRLIRTPVNADNGYFFLVRSAGSHRKLTSLIRTDT